ncbi:D-serine ammonia-lyase [Anaerococcus porci]|uniref:D-serine ammonia-lyase n=1 Tax=Anaerococcus porci TaxID=2652269 RepID=UPI002A75B533|nr:D-serine ammonia-lyase [Anaerococcus porci]MDY3006059.1 D-serine ammonia-lyase [Anaerococcus porci]
MDISEFIEKEPVLKDVANKKETVWINKSKKSGNEVWKNFPFSENDIKDAEKRLERFAPLLMEYFDDTKETNGIIESPLRKISNMENLLKEKTKFEGNLFLKMDSHLAVAGSIKARGGIYEVLSYAEKLAIDAGMLSINDNYKKLASKEFRNFFSKHTIQVGSTGNLGLSIGISSAALGFKVIVHMSNDAKQWKKDLLRSKGVEVVEYDGDFSKAVELGRKKSNENPSSYFIDDENSKTLFLGYAVAANRIKKQMEEQSIRVDKNNPVFFYIPCGVGGSPGGVSFGLKKIFGDNCHIFFVEPTHAPSMLIGMDTGLNGDISVQDFGIDGKTEADGLAVGRPSGFVGKLMEPIISGIFTIDDYKLFEYMRYLDKSEGIRIEPSACASFEGPAKLFEYGATKEYLKSSNIFDIRKNIQHISWATGGNLVPEGIMEEYLKTYLK